MALTLALSACATTGSMTTARNAETRQDYDSAVAEYTRILRENPDNKDARLGLERAKVRASQDHFARGRRLAATGKLEEALVEYPDCRGAHAGQQRDPDRTARCPWSAADQGRHSGRRQDAARGDHRPEHGGSAAWRRPARRGQPARVPGLSRSQRPRHLLRHRQVHEHQRRLRSHVSRSGHLHRSPECPTQSGADLGGQRDAQFLEGDDAADGHHHSGHAGQAARVRRRSRSHVLFEQRRSEGDHRHPPDRRRRQASGGDDRHQRHHHQGHTRAGDGGGPHHHRHRQGASGSRHRRRVAGSRSHPPATSSACRSPRPGTRRPASTARSTSMRTDSRCATSSR